MTDRQELWLVLGVLYLAECFRWVRRGSVVFRRLPLAGWQRREASEAIGNDRGDLHWTFPLPPFGDFIVARGLPWSAGPEGVATWHPATVHPNGRPLQSATFRRWEDIREIELATEKIFIEGQLWWTADSQVEAQRLASWLKRCAELPAPEREAAVRDQLVTIFDVSGVRKQLEETSPALTSLRVTGMLIWAVLLVILPVAIWQRGWMPALPMGLIALYALSGWSAWQAVKLHHAWYPRASAERLRLRWLCALSPVTAVRAAESVGRHRTERFDPLAVSLAVLPSRMVLASATAWCRDAWFPRMPENPFPSGTPAARTIDWFLGVYRDAGAAALRAAGLDPGLATRPPVPTESLHTQFCPRCHGQFLAVARLCQACGGRTLLPLTAEKSPD